MLTAGAVGAFMLTAAYAIILISFFGALALADSGNAFDMGRLFGGFALLAILAYLGGLPCLAIGFFGMRRITKSLYGLAGLLTWIHFAVIILAFTVLPMMAPELLEIRNSSSPEIIAWVTFVFVIVLFGSYGISLLKGNAGSRLAKVGGICFLVATGIMVVLWVLSLMGANGVFNLTGNVDAQTAGTLGIWIVIVFFGTLTLGHFAAGLAMLRARPTADAAAAF